MSTRSQTGDAVEILHRRYVKGDAKREASLEAERANAEVARLIRDLREDAGLSQQELADLVGTTQSVISRLEDADYEGHSLTMLTRIAKALKQKVAVVMNADSPEVGTLQYAFRLFLRNLRRERGLTVEELARQLDLDRDEVVAMERNYAYRPSPLTVQKLSIFYDLPEKNVATLAGAFRVSEGVTEYAARYVAKSESVPKLSKEEKKALDEFAGFLKSQKNG
jgi:transcriptional regulator with XRE-family HTH domain